MKGWLHSKTLKSLCGFLCLIGYKESFMKDYGIIVIPLINFLKKNSFVWNDVVE